MDPQVSSENVSAYVPAPLPVLLCGVAGADAAAAYRALVAVETGGSRLRNAVCEKQDLEPHTLEAIIPVAPLHLGDGWQGGQPAQLVELPGQERGPAEVAGQAAGGWAWPQRSLGAGSGAEQHDSDHMSVQSKGKDFLSEASSDELGEYVLMDQHLIGSHLA